MKRFLMCCIALALALAFLAHQATPSSAATHSQAASSRLAVPQTSCNNVPATTLTSILSQAGLTVSFRVEWVCAASAAVVVRLDYGDSSASLFTCGFNCSSRTIDAIHTYPRPGTYQACAHLGEASEVDHCAQVSV